MSTKDKLKPTQHMTGLLALAECEGRLRWMISEEDPDPGHLARVTKQVYDAVRVAREHLQTSVEKLGGNFHLVK